MHAVGQVVPKFRGRGEIGFVTESLVEGGAELIGGHVGAGDADDMHLWAEASLGVQISEGGGEFLGCQVTRRPEYHDGRRLLRHS